MREKPRLRYYILWSTRPLESRNRNNTRHWLIYSSSFHRKLKCRSNSYKHAVLQSTNYIIFYLFFSEFKPFKYTYTVVQAIIQNYLSVPSLSFCRWKFCITLLYLYIVQKYIYPRVLLQFYALPLYFIYFCLFAIAKFCITLLYRRYLYIVYTLTCSTAVLCITYIFYYCFGLWWRLKNDGRVHSPVVRPYIWRPQ